MLDSVDDITLRALVRKVQEVDRASGMRHIDGNVADLAQAIGTLIQAKKLRDCSGTLCAVLSR